MQRRSQFIDDEAGCDRDDIWGDDGQAEEVVDEGEDEEPDFEIEDDIEEVQHRGAIPPTRTEVRQRAAGAAVREAKRQEGKEEKKGGGRGGRHYCFTINAGPALEGKSDPEVLEGLREVRREIMDRVRANGDSWGLKYIVLGLEQGDEEKKWHLQCFLSSKAQVRGTTWMERLYSGTSYIPMYRDSSPAKCAKYCKKGDDFHEWGVCPKGGQGSRGDLDRVAEVVRESRTFAEVVAREPGAVIRYGHGLRAYHNLVQPPAFRGPIYVFRLHGDSNAGKSFTAMYYLELWKSRGLIGDFYRVMESKEGWMEGYTGQDAIWFDEFAGVYPYETLLSMLDPYPLSVFVKGSYAAFRGRIFIFSCVPQLESFYTMEEPRKDFSFAKRVAVAGQRDGIHVVELQCLPRGFDFKADPPHQAVFSPVQRPFSFPPFVVQAEPAEGAAAADGQAEGGVPAVREGGGEGPGDPAEPVRADPRPGDDEAARSRRRKRRRSPSPRVRPPAPSTRPLPVIRGGLGNAARPSVVRPDLSFPDSTPESGNESRSDSSPGDHLAVRRPRAAPLPVSPLFRSRFDDFDDSASAEWRALDELRALEERSQSRWSGFDTDDELFTGIPDWVPPDHGRGRLESGRGDDLNYVSALRNCIICKYPCGVHPSLHPSDKRRRLTANGLGIDVDSD